MKRKAQIWSLDFAISLLIFMSALFSVVFAWNYMSAESIETQELKKLQIKTLSVSDSLVRTKGIPNDWNTSTVSVIGLASEENVLDPIKVNYFVNMSEDDYIDTLSLLDLGLYDYYFEIRDVNGTMYINTSIVIDNRSNSVVPVERYALYNGRVVKMKLQVWG